MKLTDRAQLAIAANYQRRAAEFFALSQNVTDPDKVRELRERAAQFYAGARHIMGICNNDGQ